MSKLYTAEEDRIVLDRTLSVKDVALLTGRTELSVQGRRFVLSRKLDEDGRVVGAEHGTYQGYRSWGCRCEECRVANTVKSRQDREARRQRVGEVPADDPRHGTTAFANNWMCPCQKCRAAIKKRNDEYVEQHPYVPSQESRPRFTEADIALILDTSIPTEEIARRLGRPKEAIYRKRGRLRAEANRQKAER
jgi:hypothetical protein